MQYYPLGTITSTPKYWVIYNGYPSHHVLEIYGMQPKHSNSTYTCNVIVQDRWAQIQSIQLVLNMKYYFHLHFLLQFETTIQIYHLIIIITITIRAHHDYFNVYLYNETKGSNVQTLSISIKDPIMMVHTQVHVTLSGTT